MKGKKITLVSVFPKMKEYHFQPCKQKNGAMLPFVKKVRYDSYGNSEMILSPDEMNDPNRAYFIPEDLDIVITSGKTFDLSDPYQRNIWEAIKDSDLIAPTRDSRDSNGNLLIDGDAKRYGIAELYVDIEGEESERRVNKFMLINKAWNFISNDSPAGRLTKCKLLGREMYNAPESDVTDYLYSRAQDNPEEIIEVYTSGDMSLRLLLIDAKKKSLIIKKDGFFMYGDQVLGVTDDAVMVFFKAPSNMKILDSIKRHTWPEYFAAEETTETPVAEVKEPKKAATKK